MKKIILTVAALVLVAAAAPAVAGETDQAPRCLDAPVDVTGASPHEHRLLCAGAREALRVLGRCAISPSRPLQVQVMDQVLHPFGGPIFGRFDARLDKALVTGLANAWRLAKDTPLARIPQDDFFSSLAAHEVAHAVLHQHYRRRPTSHAGHEYPAYVVQMESLPATVRDTFMQAALGQDTSFSNLIFNDAILAFDPFFFAARAYQHSRRSADNCADFAALLNGEVGFIAALP